LSAEERTKALFKRRKPLRNTRALVSKEEDKIYYKTHFHFSTTFLSPPIPSLSSTHPLHIYGDLAEREQENQCIVSGI